MKLKLKLFFAVLSISAVTFWACNKENRMGEENIQTPVNEVVLDLKPNKISLSTLALSPNDKVEELINQKNIELCEVLKPLFLKTDFNKFVVETAKKDKGNVYYKQIFEAFPETKALFKNTIIGKRDIGSLNTRNSNWYDFERNGYYYDAMLYVPNYDNAQASNQVVLSPEIQSPQQETGQGDVYFAWYGQGQVIVNEGESQNMSVPVVMTSLHDVTPYPEPTTDNQPTSNAVEGSNWRLQPKSNLVGSSSNGLNTRGVVISPHIVWIPKSILNYNYDGGSNPDLYFIGCWISTKESEGSAASRRDLYQVELSDVEEECTYRWNSEDFKFTFLDWGFETINERQESFRNKRYFINAWERDWGSSCKPLGKATVEFVKNPYYFTGARRYTDEWYIYGPNRVLTIADAVPMSAMFNDPGSPRYINSDPDPRESGEPICDTKGIKAELMFSRGVKF